MYDPDYEERGLKYPVAYIRWTAKRNIEEFLKMISLGTIKLGNITTHVFPFENALEAYQMILSGKESIIGMVLQYPAITSNITPSPIDFKSIVATTLTTFAIEKSITTGEAIEINLNKWGID